MERSRMSTSALMALVLPVALAGTLALWVQPGGQRRGTAVSSITRRSVTVPPVQLARIDIPFIRNEGQTSQRVAFYAPTLAGTVFVTHSGSLVVSLPASRRGTASRPGWTLVETPVGARHIHVRGLHASATRISLFEGRNTSRWKTGLPVYAEVDLGDPWHGIDYVLRAHANNVERMFIVAPGAKAARIRMRVRGARVLRIQKGQLVAFTANGPVALSHPVAYQRINGHHRAVPVSFQVQGNTYGFRLGLHDPRRPVVIDPLIRATYLGGSGADSANAVSVEATNGDVYLAGKTTSTDFPGTTGGAQTGNTGNTDAFVAVISPGLTKLIQATYLGGSGNDFARSLVVAPAGTSMAGDVYVAGDTFSTDFPGTSSGAQPSCGGTATDCASNGDAFVAVLNPGLTQLLGATYLGGTNIDDAHALAVAPAGSTDAGQVYVAGRTLSANFPGVSGGAQPSPANSSYDGFISRFSPNLTQLLQSSYLGGTGVDEVYALLVDPSNGNVYAAGDTSSTDFPCTQAGSPPPNGGACAGGTAGAQPTLGGAFDAFVALFNPGLTSLTRATYLGGSDVDGADALAVAPAGSPVAGQIYVAGRTLSTNFPATSHGGQPQSAGNADGFVARFSAALDTLDSASYLGGSGNDEAQALTVGPSGAVYVAGQTASSDFPCTTPTGPAPSGLQACPAPHAGAQYREGGSTDGFAALFTPDLGQLSQATYLGGRDADGVMGLALAPTAGTLYAAGSTKSANFPATAGAAQPAYAGTGDGVAAAMSSDLQGPQVTVNTTLNAPQQATAGNSFQYTVTVTNNSPPPSGSYTNDATNVDVDNALNYIGPGQVTYESATASQGQGCTETNGVVECKLGTLAPNGGSATITVTVKATKTTGNVTEHTHVFLDQATTSASTFDATVKTDIKSAPSSGGGGALGPLVLLLLTMLAAPLPWRRRPKRG